MSPAIRLTQTLGKLALAAGVASAIGVSASGCSARGGAADSSPASVAKSKEAFKKRFQNYGVKPAGKTPRRSSR
jgi:hypothetical protein